MKKQTPVQLAALIIGGTLGLATIAAQIGFIAQHGRLPLGSGEVVNWLFGLGG